MPYAGFFSEKAPRDKYIKKNNVKNKTQDFKSICEANFCKLLDPSINQFFERLKMSINMIERQNNYESSKKIFVFGQGFDSLIYDSNFEIPVPFYNANEIEQIKYNEIDTNTIKDSTMINKSIDSKIFISNLILNSID